MATRQRRLSAAQARRDVMRQQWSFAGGMVSDRHPSSLGSGQVAELVNLRPDGDRLVAVRAPTSVGSLGIAKTATILASGMGRTDDVQSGAAPSAFAWVLATDGSTTTSLFTYKTNGSAFAGTVNLTDWVGYASTITAVSYRDGVLVRSTNGIMAYVPFKGALGMGGTTTYTYGSVLRINDPRPLAPITGPVPGSAFALTLTTGNSGTEVYQFVYTMVAKSSYTGQVLWESLPLQMTASDSVVDVAVDTWDGTKTVFSSLRISHTFDRSLMDNIQTEADGSFNPSLITHVRVWRTLNVGNDPAFDTVATPTGNRKDEFFLVGEYAWGVGDTLTLDIGAGGSYPAVDDDMLVYQPHLEQGLSVMTAVGGPICWQGGILWTASGNLLQYSETEGAPEHAGYWFAGGPQERTMQGAITAIAGGDGFALICTTSRITRFSTQAGSEVAQGSYPWMSRTCFWSETIVLDGEGIASNDLVDQVPGGLLMATTSAQVRLFDGTTLGQPLDKGRVHDTIRTASMSWLVYSPDGFAILKTSAGILRIDMQDGTPWSIYEPTVSIGARPFRVFAADGLGGKTGLLEVYQGATYWTAQVLSVDSAQADLAWSVRLPQYKGEWDGYMVLHRETILTAGGTWTDASATLLTDANGEHEYGQRAALQETISLDGAEMASISLRRTIQQLRYVQLEIVGTSTNGVVLHRVQTTCEVQDRPWRAVEVLGGTYDRSLDLFGEVRGGWDGYAWSGGSVTGTPTTDWGTMDDASLDNDGHKWLGSVLGAGCWADLSDTIETGALMVVSLWLRLSDLEALTGWAPLLDIGTASVSVGPGTVPGEWGIVVGGNKDATGSVYTTATTDTDEWINLVLQAKADAVRVDASGEVITRGVIGEPTRLWIGRVGGNTGATPAVFDVRVCRDSSTTYLALAAMRTDWGSCFKRIDPSARIVEQ